MSAETTLQSVLDVAYGGMTHGEFCLTQCAARKLYGLQDHSANSKDPLDDQIYSTERCKYAIDTTFDMVNSDGDSSVLDAPAKVFTCGFMATSVALMGARGEI